MTLAFGPVLLIPSALGWWIGGAFLRLRGPSATPRPAVQGASAGLAAHILFSTEIGWMPPTLIGIPIGALFGWLVFIRWFPMLPDIAVRDADA
ncbi:hypothetical protein [Paracoccus xiamenensis]|uniref:hypothetical protein n=1 Tax=Paracoccus xiamenensis TaxID=2714901 RepID=UPI00140BD847|nr:hypothetical protein [Paracoccus xiamenensis]NHF72217.1 hypothetical protein [Paracoccus xiamenensis]